VVPERKVQKQRYLHRNHSVFGLAFRAVEFCRRPLVAYVIIAFSIGFGFHELENRTDRQLAKSIVESCHQSNQIRIDVNRQLRTLKLGTPADKPQPVTIPLADCHDGSGP
jgi:hypothetical protein